MARGRAAGRGVVQHANETRQSAVTQAQAQRAWHVATQAHRRCMNVLHSTAKFANKKQCCMSEHGTSPVQVQVQARVHKGTCGTEGMWGIEGGGKLLFIQPPVL